MNIDTSHSSNLVINLRKSTSKILLFALYFCFLTPIFTSCQNNKSMNEEFFKNLTPEERRVIVNKGTEAPFTGEYDDFYEPGIFVCKACGNHLYDSSSKFDAGCGWPAFDKVKDGAISTYSDFHLGYERTEITCAKCDGHLGHVFKGENFTSENTRHCVNSISVRFVSEEFLQTAIFGAGCFWSVEEFFRKVDGVYSTEVGYIGGQKVNPSYEEVCSDKTGHAEAVKVSFDSKRVSYEKLLELFWANHNPTTLNKQGPDSGSQYRSAIFYNNDQQKDIAIQSIKDLESKGQFNDPIVTEVVPATQFYKAEEYHQKYLLKRGKGSCKI
jgi:peptide methionine sulfoxide reductase msrA/msrB